MRGGDATASLPLCPACLLIAAAEQPPGYPASGFEPLSIAAVDAALPAYDVQVLLGQGGTGTVYRARHKKLDRLVAIKVLRPAPTLDPAESAAFAERFEREARVLAKLDHPHIVRIYDFGQSSDPTQEAPPFYFLVLEYVEGASLRDLLQSGRLTARDVLEFVPQICDALQAAHDLGVVHRDIKPENILVDSNGRVRVADFGLAKLRGTEPTAYGLTLTHQVMGTLHYMAPEQLKASGSVDHRADLFSLGVVLYEMLTGELPIGRFAPPSKASGVSKGLDHVVLKSLENDPDERYQAASDLREEIIDPDCATDEEPVAGPVTRRTRRMQRRRERIGGTTVAPEPRAEAPAAVDGLTGTTRAAAATRAGARSALDPGSQFAMKRSVWGLVVLLFAYTQTWLVIPTLGMSIKVGGFNGYLSLGIFSVPFYLALIAYAAATIARVLRWRGMEVNEALPWLLTMFGFVLTGYVISTILLGDGAELRGGIILAFGVFLGSSMLDVSAFMERGDKRSRQREIAREIANSGR